MPDNYKANPETVQEHVANVKFQLAGMEGYLAFNKLDGARIKAACLLRAAEHLVERLREEMKEAA